MRELGEAGAIIRRILGDNAKAYFDSEVGEFLYIVRSLAFEDMATETEVVRAKLEKMSHVIINKSVTVFLRDRYGVNSKDTIVGITVTESGVFDRNMNPVEEIHQIRKSRSELTDIIMGNVMDEFLRGRVLCREIVGRLFEYRARNGGSVHQRVDEDEQGAAHEPPRDYADRPPMEQLEVELMRLESKLPKLTPDEGKKLLRLYETLKDRGDSGGMGDLFDALGNA